MTGVNGELATKLDIALIKADLLMLKWLAAVNLVLVLALFVRILPS